MYSELGINKYNRLYYFANTTLDFEELTRGKTLMGNKIANGLLNLY